MGRVFTVGIGGESAGGKSTLADFLEKKLADYKVKTFHMDAYFKEESMRPRVNGIWNGKVYRDDNHPDTMDLELLHSDVKKAEKENLDVILIEGMFSLWDEELAPLLDLKVYVDCDQDERLSRRVRRNLSYGQELDEIMERYVQAVQPRQKEFVTPTKWKADLIVNGFRTAGDMPAGADIILSWIEKCVKEKL